MKLEMEIDFAKLGEELAKHDFVQVVRCKDCKYFHENVFGDEIGLGKPYDSLIVGHCGCEFWAEQNDMKYTAPDAFCSYGERKEEDA